MDPRLLRYYDQELQHLREMGSEFALQFPKIAERLGMSGIAVADPYVERLMEGFAFLAARVQLKIDAEFPRFTERLLEIVYPDYLGPTPAMLIAQFRPDLSDANLARGFSIPRGSGIRGQLGKGDTAACQFRTAHDVTLWPLEIAIRRVLLVCARFAAESHSRRSEGEGRRTPETACDGRSRLHPDRTSTVCGSTCPAARTSPSSCMSFCSDAVSARLSCRCRSRHPGSKSCPPAACDPSASAMTRHCCRRRCAVFRAIDCCTSTSRFRSASCSSTSTG